jgi:hypothetical protein
MVVIKKMNTQELLVSSKNRDILLETVYSMIGIDLNEDEKNTLRFNQISADLNEVLHDINTDFIKVLQMLKSENEYKIINRQIALHVYQKYEHRNEKFFNDEEKQRQIQQNFLKSTNSILPSTTVTFKEEEEDFSYSKRSEVLLSNFDSFEYKVSPSERFGFFSNTTNTNFDEVAETPRSFFSKIE